MALTQAQVLTSLVYRKEKTISLGQRMYIFDMDCSKKGYLCISASNNFNKDNFNSYKAESDSVLFTSPSGLHIALEEIRLGTHFKYIYGTHHSVEKEEGILRSHGFKQHDNVKSKGYRRWELGVYDHKLLWGENNLDHNHFGCEPKLGFTPQGIAVTKSGSILVCLWNNEFGERSSGKVISIDGKLQIFNDKNKPLYVCPTYIAENGNGDICVSDVRTVVVTDRGGMLRFRYQGNSGSSNFDPYGICCDSSCNIIIADMKNNKIHVVGKDDEFLHHVVYEGIRMPRALCIDENDKLYVGEWDTDSIKVIVR